MKFTHFVLKIYVIILPYHYSSVVVHPRGFTHTELCTVAMHDSID